MLLQVRRHPQAFSIFNTLSRLEDEVGSFADDSRYSVNGNDYPSVDVAESGEALTISVELPGVKKEDIRLSIEKDVLTVRGTRASTGLPQDSQWLLSEIRTGEFTRSFVLPRSVDQKRVEAELQDGILRIRLPKAEETRPRQVSIS